MIDLDEQLFPLDHTFIGFHTHAQIEALEEEFAAAKADEWFAVTALAGAAYGLRSAARVPANAPIAVAIDRAQDRTRAGDTRAARRLAEFTAAASDYEGARTAVEAIRQQAHTRR
ncbi:hypothetical protein [Spirillospora sp. NBC_01491]|uniref:hypothetical protein n=1 Tax=Spirillospora sp. NBC_01491 TaxID=2976007 RepID=UPI002E30FE8E|nr:hypothetical protein [Spirillospora sp. NBC_01491]